MMKFSIISRRKIWYALALIVMIPGFISMAVQGFNLGIDFTGGTLLDLQFAKPVTVEQVRGVLKDYNLDNSMIQLAGVENATSSSDVMIRTVDLSETDRREVMDGLKKGLGDYNVLRTERVGAVMGSELTIQAIIATLLSWVLIVLYITYRFEFKFAIAGILALAFDVIVVLAAFTIFQKEVDATFVAALMTVVGYSTNDKIVIFDRIRENLKLHFRKGGDLVELGDNSIWQTMTRSIYTVVTVLFTVVALFLFGGDTTKNFSFALLVGVSCGAFSSIFIATPLWIDFRFRSDKKRLEAAKSN